jgi:2-hydroxychromene-2-carboxylate isomerase
MRSGVTGTPSFFINDRAFLSRQHHEELYEAILAVGGKTL